MSISYLPGWWDELNRGGAVTNFVQNLDKRLRPDAYAQQDLQKMIQQNPMILDQIANMNPEQRNMMAAGMGFKNQNPFQALPEGQKIKDQRTKDEIIAAARSTPEGNAEFIASQTGTKTADERKAGQLSLQKIEQELANGQTTGKLNTLKLAQLEKESARLDKILQQKAPDVRMIAQAVVAGKPISPADAERIGADPYLKATYDNYVRSLQIRMQTDANKYIASLKTPVEKQLGLDALKVQIMQTQQQLSEATNATSGREGMMNQFSMDPQIKDMYNQSLKMIPVLRQRQEQLNKIYIENLKKLGMEIPSDMPFLTDLANQKPANPLGARSPLGALTNQFFGPPR